MYVRTIAYDYDFRQFPTHGLSVLHKGLKIGPFDYIEMPKASKLPGTPPHKGQAPGLHADLLFARSLFTL